jgi:acyl-CoA synthetase (AMP-forming)/AMP-acid ligase II
MEWLIERFQTESERIAFIHEGREVSYGGVVESIGDFYQRVLEAGIKHGETAVVVGDYSPEVFCMIMSLCRIGSIVIPLTRTSIVEESVALAVSGCEWYVEFDAAGRDATITHRGLKIDNALLDEFRQRGTPGMVLFSSGSTGKPKGILHDFNQVVEKFRKKRAPVIAIPFLMIDHFGGINTILAITSSLGTVVTVADRSVANICAAIEKYKVELLPATPSFLTLMMASHLQNKYNLSSLKRITYGTEVMPQSTLDRVRSQFPGVDLLQTYGLSEVGVLRSQSREDGSLWVRVGGEGFQTKVVNGVLWIKSQYAMVGYLNAPSEFDSEGWFNTQDRVEVDGEYFQILGRVTDLINVAGQKVYPAEIESVILDIPNIQDVAVFGEKHSLLGQIVVAKVVLLEEESVESVKKRIRQACHGHLAAFKVPTKVILAEGPLHSSRQKKIRKE